MGKTESEPVDNELAEEIAEGEALPKPADIKEEPKLKAVVGGFHKPVDIKESSYNGLVLWAASYDQWFELLVNLSKGSKICTGTTKKDFAVDGMLLWTSSWDEKFAMLEKLSK